MAYLRCEASSPLSLEYDGLTLTASRPTFIFLKGHTKVHQVRGANKACVLISSLPPLLTICSQPLHSSTEISVQQSRSPSPSSQDTLTLRALVTTKDAGVIIGKGGKNVADLRDETGVKAGVSKVIPGVHERVLTVTGSVEGVAKVRMAFSGTIL